MDIPTESPTTLQTNRSTIHEESVVWFVNSLGYGKELLYWGDILPGYIHHFPQSQFFTTVDGDKPIVGTEKTVQQVTSLLIRLGRRQGSYDRKFSLVFPWSLRSVRQLKPQVVVISEFTMPSLYVAATRRWLGCRVLLLVESDPLRGKIHRIKAWSRWLRRFVARRVDMVLTNNEAGRQYVCDHLHVSPDRILCRPYVVSTGRPVTPDGRSIAASIKQKFNHDGRVVFLYVGQLIERKGMTQLIDAVTHLSPADRQRIRIWLVGDGEQRQKIQARVDREGLADTVQLIGAVPYHEVSAYYGAADVFVMPTLDDYRALVGFEAIGFGLPLLYSIHDGAVGEVVREGANGWSFDPYDSHQFAEKLRWFVQHSQSLDGMGAVSREMARHFTLEEAVDTLVTATRRCLSL